MICPTHGICCWTLAECGLKVCDHCNGYGGSLKDPPGVNRCTKCGGDGLVADNETPKQNRKL